MGMVGLIELTADFIEAAKAVEQFNVGFRMKQGLVIVLTVDIDQSSTQLCQLGNGDGDTIEEHAVLVFLRQHAPDDPSAFLGFYAEGLCPRPCFRIVNFEYRFHRGGVLAGTDAVRIGATPDDQIERTDDDRFTGSGFTRQHIEARVKPDFEFFDNSKMLDADFFEHRD